MANNLNPNTQHHWQFDKQSAEDYFEGLQSGNRTVISRCISLAESSNLNDKVLVNTILEKAHSSWINNDSIRIGITGPPGVGKSSFIEQFGLHIADTLEETLAVLAIDPSSADSKGCLLYTSPSPRD